MHFRDIEKLWAELPNTLWMKWETLDVLVTPDNHFNDARISNVLFMFLWKALFESRVEISKSEYFTYHTVNKKLSPYLYM